MDAKIEARQRREAEAAEKAKREGKGHSYVDDDGCEVTVTAQGAVFYNAADWY